ncbi:unnamed protein product [Ectocarpus sp. 12 AP-2014]
MNKKVKQEGRADARTRTRAAATSDTMGNVPNTSVTKESKEQRTRGVDSLRRSIRNAGKGKSRGSTISSSSADSEAITCPRSPGTGVCGWSKTSFFSLPLKRT